MVGDAVVTAAEGDAGEGEGLSGFAWEMDVERVDGIGEVEDKAVVGAVDVGRQDGEAVVADAGQKSLGGVAKEDDAAHGIVEEGFGIDELDGGGNIVGGDGYAAEAERAVELFEDVAGEGDFLDTVHFVVVGVVATGGGGIGEEESTTANKIGIGSEQTGADPMGKGAGLNMGAPDVQDAEVALSGGIDFGPLVEEMLHGGRGGVEVERVEVETDERVVGLTVGGGRELCHEGKADRQREQK